MFWLLPNFVVGGKQFDWLVELETAAPDWASAFPRTAGENISEPGLSETVGN